MKKLLRNLSMLTLMIIGGAQMAWAQESTTLYERTSSTWTEEDIADWGNPNATISEGLVQKGTNSGWSATKELTFTANSKVTLTATLVGGHQTGRDTSYDYLTIGGISLRLNGQTKEAYIDIDGTSTKLSGFTRDGTYNLTITINQATGDVTYNVTGAATGQGAGKTSTELGKVTVGHFRGGREGSEVVTLKLSSIKVSEEAQAVEMANYTINYLYNSATIKTDNGTTAVNNVVEATSPIKIEGNKYYAADGVKTSLTVTNDEAKNVLNVELRAAHEYNYTVKNNFEENIATGVSIEGEPVYAAFPKFKNVDGTLHEAPKVNDDSYYKFSFVPTSDNYVHTITYSATKVKNVVYYSEGEDITDAIATSAGNNMEKRSSNAACGYTTKDVTIAHLLPGNYQVITCVYSNSKAGTTLNFAYGTETFTVTNASASNGETHTNNITITEATDLVWQTSGDSKNGLDYVYIVKLPVTISLPAAYIYSTFCSEYDLDFTDNADVKAYIAHGDGENVILEQVNRVPAGIGVILEKQGDATTATVPVVEMLELTDEEGALLKRNALVGVSDGPVSAKELIDFGAYILEDDTKFSKVVEGAEGELAVGKAFLVYDANGGSLKMNILDGEATAIKGVEVKATRTDNAVYNLQGVRVNKPTANGLYIINGKKYLHK